MICRCKQLQTEGSPANELCDLGPAGGIAREPRAAEIGGEDHSADSPLDRPAGWSFPDRVANGPELSTATAATPEICGEVGPMIVPVSATWAGR